MSRVIGSEHVLASHGKGETRLEILPGDIVTQAARESAVRLNVLLIDGPLEKPAVRRTDGSTSLRRVLYRRSPKWVPPKRNRSIRSHRLSKLGLIGAGGVGGNIGHLAANADICDLIAFVDIAPGLAEATALDLNHASGISRVRTRAVGGNEYGIIAGSDVVVVTAGRPRTPGMNRSDLISINRRVIHSAAEAIKVHAPEAVVIVVTNPLDEMTLEMIRATGFPRERVLGMAGTLDSSRFRVALAKAANVTPADVEAFTLGSHGDEMAPIVSRARIKGRPLDIFLTPEQINACVKDAVTGGGQVVALRKTGSATLAPAHASIELIDHMRGARAGAVPASVYLKGEYGIHDVVLGVPCQLGMRGLLSIDQFQLDGHELQSLKNAAEAIRRQFDEAAQ